MNRPTSYSTPKDMSIKALNKILLREENDEADRDWDEWATIQNNSRKAVLECPHLSNELLNDYSPSNAYLLEKAYPTKQTRMALDEPTGLPPTEVGLIFLSAMIPHIICIGIIVWIAIFGF